MLGEAVQVVPVVGWTVLSVEVLVEAVRVVPVVVVDIIVSRSARRGRTGSTSGNGGHYCQ